jgi:hypothetical protein
MAQANSDMKIGAIAIWQGALLHGWLMGFCVYFWG